MKLSLRVLLVCVLSLVAAHTFAGDAPAGLAVPGKVLFEDDFARAEMTPKWRVGKGTWEVKDGVVTATENPDDKHSAYAYIKPGFPCKDLVVEYSAKIDGGRVIHLMINDSNYKESHAGHILRAAVYPKNKVNVADWKFGAMKNEIFDKMKEPATTDEEKKKLRDSIKDKTAVFKPELDFAEWHAVKIEIVGDEMLVSIDGKPAAYLKSQGIDHPTKNAIGFEIGGKSGMVKAMKVSEATASPDWAKNRDVVIAGLKK